MIFKLFFVKTSFVETGFPGFAFCRIFHLCLTIVMPQSSFKKYQKTTGLLAGLLLCSLIYLIDPLQMGENARRVLSIAILMISWWIFDAMPLPAVALLPLVLFPLAGIKPIKEVAPSYGDEIIFLFMGGFFIGLAIEKWNLHKRIALGIINITGTNGNRIILGFILATGGLSMWLSNTATTMMMFPIALSVIHVTGNRDHPEGNMKNFSLALMLSIAFASNFGGIATVIGTPPNVWYVAHIKQEYSQQQYNIGFINWLLLCMPLAICMLLMLYWVLVKWLFPNRIVHSEESRRFVKTELAALGPLSGAETRVLAVFIFTASLWIFKDLINKTGIPPLTDTIIALVGALLLFIVPSGATKDEPEERLLNWGDTKNMAWGILILFGGGLALAKALEDAGLMKALGASLSRFILFDGAPAWGDSRLLVVIFVVTTLSVFLSEVMSNIAQVMVLGPIMTSMAVMAHINPLLLGVPMALGASCASMLPMGTPPNAIVFSSGHIPLRQMLRAGFVLNCVCIVLITLFCWLLLPLVLPAPPDVLVKNGQ
jgi:solute carrier family 13 (sodium-dependent dicarboxylate transporter), member 2/3/5